MLGNRVRRVSWHAHYGNTCFSGSVKIDVVEAGATKCDEPNAPLSKCPYDLPVDMIIDENADSLETRGQAGRFRFEVRCEVHQVVVPAGRVEKVTIVTASTEDGDLQQQFLTAVPDRQAEFAVCFVSILILNAEPRAD